MTNRRRLSVGGSNIETVLFEDKTVQHDPLDVSIRYRHRHILKYVNAVSPIVVTPPRHCTIGWAMIHRLTIV
jgi:hypothetical protein